MKHSYSSATPLDTDLHCKDLNDVAIDDQLPILDFHGSLEPPVGRVILEQVSLHTEVTKINIPDQS